MDSLPETPLAVRGARRRWRRRWGVVFLGLSVGMVVLGLTRFEPLLRGVRFLLYWFACMLATSFALVIAALEATAVQIAVRREQRAAAEAALGEIRREAQRRAAGRGPADHPG